MRRLTAAALIGAVTLAVAGTAIAANKNNHVLDVALPDGSVAHVAYQGDVAPRVLVDDRDGFAPVALADPADSPFAMFDRIAADMDRQMAAMLSQATAMPMQPQTTADGKPDLAAFGNMPAGSVTYSYSYVSTGNGKTSCTQSYQLTSRGPNVKPQVVSSSSGDCGSTAAPDRNTTPASQPARPLAPKSVGPDSV